MAAMNVRGRPHRSIWLEGDVVKVIDQRHLPHRLVVERLRSLEACVVAIRDMHVRGAGLIGVTAGFGVWLAARAAERRGLGVRARGAAITRAVARLEATRPTAVNLAWAAHRVAAAGASAELMRAEAQAILREDVEMSRRIGAHGLRLIRRVAARKRGRPVEVMTHCNAGWLAFVDFGTATAPIYLAHDAGIPVHVWVSETRPRNQGAKLTAWELAQHGVPHTVIADSAAGHLMQHGHVDLVIVGADRVTRTGYAANKIGTYLKALAAHDNGVPFYVAVPSSTFDWTLGDGVREIPIEERGGEEVTRMDGWSGGRSREVRVTPRGSRAANYGFDVTPPRLITGLITDRGVCRADERSIRALLSRAPHVVTPGVHQVPLRAPAGNAPGVGGEGSAARARRPAPEPAHRRHRRRRGLRQPEPPLRPRHAVHHQRQRHRRAPDSCGGRLREGRPLRPRAQPRVVSRRPRRLGRDDDARLGLRSRRADRRGDPCPRPRVVGAVAEDGSAAHAARRRLRHPAIARAMCSVVRAAKRPIGVVVMAGHEGGLISYGRTLPQAARALREAAGQARG